MISSPQTLESTAAPMDADPFDPPPLASPRPPSSQTPESAAAPLDAELYRLGASPAARRLFASPRSEEELITRVRSYIAQGVKQQIPPTLWLAETQRARGRVYFVPPLSESLYAAIDSAASRAPAVEALLRAGCSLFAPSRLVDLNQNSVSIVQWQPDPLVYYLLHGQGLAVRRLLLRHALADKDAPLSFLETLCSSYDDEINGSTLAPGVWGPADERAASICSFLSEFSPELRNAAKRPGWDRAKTLADDAERRAALKRAPAPFDLGALSRSLTLAQTSRLGTIALVMAEALFDPQAVMLLLEGSPWLKAAPQLACLKRVISEDADDSKSLLSLALRAGCEGAIDWLEKAGSNIFLAAAQHEAPDAFLWAVDHLPPGLPQEGFDFAPLARMLLNGARAFGPDGPADFLKQAGSNAGKIPQEWERENAAALLSAMESLSIAAETAPAAPSPARRSL